MYGMPSELEVVVIGSLSDVGSFDFVDEVMRVKASMLYGDRIRVESPKVPVLLGIEFARTRLFPRYLQERPHLIDDGMAERLATELEARSEARGQSDRFSWLADRIRSEGVAFVLELPEVVSRMAAAKGEDLTGLGPSAFQDLTPDAIRSQLRRKKPANEAAFRKAADDLAKLLECGVATLDTQPAQLDAIITSEVEDVEGQTDKLLERIVELLLDPSRSSHPLFSREARATVRELAGKGRLAKAHFRNANRVAIANQLVCEIPSFPQASVDELLDVRERVAPHLARFRKAVGEFDAKLSVDISAPDFDAAVHELSIADVQPALEELRQSLRDNDAIPTLTRGVPLAAGSTLALGASLMFGAPDLAGFVAAAVGVSTTVAREVQHRLTSDKERRANQLFLLFDAGRALERR